MPQNRDAVITDIKRIGDLQREASRLETEMNDAIAEITEKFAARIAPIKTDIETLSKGVQGWCEANRDELTNGGKVKTANLVTGDVSWRVRPPSVSIRGMDAVMETLERLGLQRFIRTKQEINKEAILLEPKAVAGVAGITVKSGIEDFSIIPFEQEAGI
ncbi:host-nuclease inhibitor Gam family protein [Salmonella enterica subsp. enterica serovar Montevideo]|uniref:Host-nuclease inhibitor protein Gam n=3 Tax=Enterobacterales TaxID=91347 RepID=A0A5Z9VNR6_SALET|nr:host-nuclease inhibitor protein Gam [Salmonella enterica subsp. enterica serovar Adelaide]EGJ1571537.1 host-nuclease inhibitor protein Gam [Escherichia coli]EHB9712381.1 host-nuclease inhibitor protein Gam [Salmonella enterica]EHP1181458.1 host-nuclease inhibitor Gam family protein [Salmonella enterica subsp. enterica serovar Montevideo]EGT3151997.1 host-nuclease inhibitor protein Gam [Salmonella enterica subsp. enterica serovar Adelaide]